MFICIYEVLPCNYGKQQLTSSLHNHSQADPFNLFSRHFLFKTSSGSTPLFSSSSPGYPLTSGTVYTPPPRLLPRNTFSRKAFKLKKPSKYCSWKCAALSAIAAALLLAILLAYFIGKWKPPWFHPGGEKVKEEAMDLWILKPSDVCTICLLALKNRNYEWWIGWFFFLLESILVMTLADIYRRWSYASWLCLFLEKS